MGPETQSPRGGLALLDAVGGTIADNWDVTGMQCTGSLRVGVEETFVPSYRMPHLRETTSNEIGDHPGQALYSNPLYHGAIQNVASATRTI